MLFRSRSRKRTDDPGDVTRFQEGGQPYITVARVVVHDREVARTVIDERMNELGRVAGFAETADKNAIAVSDDGNGLVQGSDSLVYHIVRLSAAPGRFSLISQNFGVYMPNSQG